MTFDRRTFLTAGALGLTAAAVPAWAIASGDHRRPSPTRSPSPTSAPLPPTGVTGRVVVIGGGMGGASVAKYLRLWGGSGMDVTLVERSRAYTSNIMSNLVLTGQRSLDSLAYTWGALTSAYGVKVVTAEAQTVDKAARTVGLSNGTTLPYDRLVLAPGIQFDPLPGLTVADYDTRFPHAWQAGPQTTLLRNQLTAMRAGGTVVMTIPPVPYRCPPGPYERACLIADWLKQNKPGSKVIVLDANPGIVAEPKAFTEGFNTIHAGVIRYVPNAVISTVDAATKTVHTSAGSFTADVLNPIPPHRAGKLAADLGLVTVAGRWVGVDVLTYESVAAPRIHVIGDAIGTTQPKSGHIANAEAKVAADAIVNLLAARAVDQAPVTNSACYSPITMSTASWLTGVFQYDAGARAMAVRSIGEAPTISASNYSDMSKWFTGLMADTYR